MALPPTVCQVPARQPWHVWLLHLHEGGAHSAHRLPHLACESRIYNNNGGVNIGKKRCRMHGGAPGSGASRGNKNALKHGRYTREAIEERRQLRALLRQSRMLIQQIE
jgi:hypothetical protein